MLEFMHTVCNGEHFVTVFFTGMQMSAGIHVASCNSIITEFKKNVVTNDH